MKFLNSLNIDMLKANKVKINIIFSSIVLFGLLFFFSTKFISQANAVCVEYDPGVVTTSTCPDGVTIISYNTGYYDYMCGPGPSLCFESQQQECCPPPDGDICTPRQCYVCTASLNESDCGAGGFCEGCYIAGGECTYCGNGNGDPECSLAGCSAAGYSADSASCSPCGGAFYEIGNYSTGACAGGTCYCCDFIPNCDTATCFAQGIGGADYTSCTGCDAGDTELGTVSPPTVECGAGSCYCCDDVTVDPSCNVTECQSRVDASSNDAGCSGCVGDYRGFFSTDQCGDNSCECCAPLGPVSVGFIKAVAPDNSVIKLNLISVADAIAAGRGVVKVVQDAAGNLAAADLVDVGHAEASAVRVYTGVGGGTGIWSWRELP